LKIENEGFAIFNDVVFIFAKLRILGVGFTCGVKKILLSEWQVVWCCLGGDS